MRQNDGVMRLNRRKRSNMEEKTIERRLKDIQDNMVVLADMVYVAIRGSVEALKNRDLALAQQIVENDLKINRKRFEIEEQCIQLLKTERLTESDLRMVIAVLNVIVDLERMGDHAEGIAKIAVMLGDKPPLKPLIDIPRMAEKTSDMLKRSIQAFIDRDAEVARRIPSEDDEIDALNEQVFRELLVIMLGTPAAIPRAEYLIWVARNLERIADRVTNICERVVFMVTGRIEVVKVSKY
jgi:phosphate transport system protein